MKRITLYLLLLALALPALAVTSIQVTVPSRYELFFVGDLDPEGGLEGVGQEITVAIHSELSGEYTGYAYLEFGGTQLVYGRFYSSNMQPFDYGPWSLNDLRNNRLTGFVGSGSYNRDFLSAISGNTLPTGIYYVRVFLYPGNWSLSQMQAGHPVDPIFSASRPIRIEDPRRVDLQLPWNGAQVHSEQPNFAWSGRAQRYAIRVCRFDPEFHASLQEAMEGDPEWVNGNLSAPQATYGQGGSPARPLEPGATYAWRVDAVLVTTSGMRHFPSEIRSFRVSLPGGGQEAEFADLFSILSPGQLAGIGAMLQRLHLNGPILIDGREVSQEELQQLLQELASGEKNIASMRIE